MGSSNSGYNVAIDPTAALRQIRDAVTGKNNTPVPTANQDLPTNIGGNSGVTGMMKPDIAQSQGVKPLPSITGGANIGDGGYHPASIYAQDIKNVAAQGIGTAVDNTGKSIADQTKAVTGPVTNPIGDAGNSVGDYFSGLSSLQKNKQDNSAATQMALMGEKPSDPTLPGYLDGANRPLDQFKVDQPAAYQGGSVYRNLASSATSTSPSPWLNAATAQQKQDEANQLNSAYHQTAGNNAANLSNLAMHGGGLTSGARERMNMGASRDLNATDAGIMSAGASNRLGLQTQDEQNKMNQLNTAAGMETNMGLTGTNQALTTSQANAQNALAATGAQSNNNLNLYGQKMAGYGSDVAANAIQNSGKK